MMGKTPDKNIYALSENDIRLANQTLDSFIDSCSIEIFRTFLPSISKEYSVIPYESKGEVADSVAYFQISKFVENEKEKMVDCLKSVYHVLANTGCGVALVIHRKQNGCEIGLAVGNPAGSSERTIKDAACLKDAFKGNFPGSICGDIMTDSNSNNAVSTLFKQLSSDYSTHKQNSLAVVSNIATEFADDYSTQGIEKLLDGIRPTSLDTEYTLLILGEALKNEELEDAKESLYKNYTDLSPFASEQKSVSVNEAKQSNWNWSAVVFGHSWGKSEGKDEGISIDVTNYKVKHTLDVIEKQMERMEESAALGLWNYSTYIISPDNAVTNEVAHMYMSLTQGKESFAEQSAINVWNGQDENAANQINDILHYLRFLRHPRFKKDNKGKPVTATAIISGAEFARSLSFPQKSVSGFPVFKCARFGRDISTYTDRAIEPVEIGQIYHMRQIESTQVFLDKKSLASHVFVTGSTGAGKTNTVFQIIKKTKVPFLIIEPAKGEYKDVFGGEEDIRVLGTNPKITELLRMNPFSFPKNISVNEHVDRLVELFNVCWPMYAAMPAILKDSVIKAYESAGWDMELSENRVDESLFPTFEDVLEQIRYVLNSSEYSADNKSDYTGALVTRLRSLTNGINGHIFSADEIPDKDLFDAKVIIDLSRVGSTETKAMIMGLLVLKLQEYRMSSGKPNNSDLKHITVLEEAHNILRRTSVEQTSEGANLLGKSVEMLTNSIAEMRSFGEGFIIADQAPGLLDMAVIRNTNTKIIHRLPDLSDRELVGGAAGLNVEQIEELAKLELGVAAIYQNDWIEPILCKVNEFSNQEKSLYSFSDKQEITKDTQEARVMVRNVLLNPNEFIRIDLSLIKRSNLPAKVKIVIIEMSKGHLVPEDQLAKAFYMLYPGLHLEFKKDENGDYLNNIFDNVVNTCGNLSQSELKIASVYLLAVSSGLNRVEREDYTKIRKELMAHGSSNS